MRCNINLNVSWHKNRRKPRTHPPEIMIMKSSSKMSEGRYRSRTLDLPLAIKTAARAPEMNTGSPKKSIGLANMAKSDRLPELMSTSCESTSQIEPIFGTATRRATQGDVALNELTVTLTQMPVSQTFKELLNSTDNKHQPPC